MPTDPRPFDDVLAAYSAAADTAPEPIRSGYWLNVLRAIHRDFPESYGNPDENGRPAEIAAADALLAAL